MDETRFEILEHTADVGFRARGRDLPRLFANATEALATIIGVWQPGEGERILMKLEADDVGALLVDWLSEVIFLHDTRYAAVAGIEVEEVSENRAEGCIVLVPFATPPDEGVQVKAITYHQLMVERGPEGWVAEVYVDV